MPQAFTISLRSLPRAALFLGIVAAPLSLFVAQTVRISLAESWGDSGQPTRVHQAIALDPQNAELYYQRANLYLFDLAADPSQAVVCYRRATALNPNRAEYWLGQARGCSAIGDRACAGDAFERAIQAAPMRPSLEQEAASYYAITGEQDKMLGHLQRLLQFTRYDPALRHEAFQLAWHAFDDPARVWNALIAPFSDAALQADYLNYLAEKNRFDLTAQYWPRIAQDANSISLAMVEPYLERLLEEQQYEQASTVWQDLLKLGAVRCDGDCEGERSSGNLVFDGRFTQPIRNAGFGWRTRVQEYVRLQPPNRDRGERGIRIEFTVAHNAADEPLDQLVSVLPNQSYLLTAWTRSEAITSDSGPRLRITDVRCPSCLDVSTEGAVGSTPWHRVELAFAAGPQTRFVRLSVWRPRSRSAPMEISGSAWFDEISIHRESAALLPATSR